MVKTFCCSHRELGFDPYGSHQLFQVPGMQCPFLTSEGTSIMKSPRISILTPMRGEESGCHWRTKAPKKGQCEV